MFKTPFNNRLELVEAFVNAAWSSVDRWERIEPAMAMNFNESILSIYIYIINIIY